MSKFLTILALLIVGVLILTAQQQNFNNAGGLPTGLTFALPTMTVSTAGSGNGQLALSGNTSGTATLTAGATGAQITSSTQLTVPAGACNGVVSVNNGGNGGIAFPGGANTVSLCGGNQENMRIGTNTLNIGVSALQFGSTVTATDAGVSRIAAGVTAIGNGTAADTTGRVKAAGYMSVGTTFTSNAGCGDTTLVGGATAGKYTSVTAGTCTTIITMGNSATAPNGWSCTATDLTTAADAGNIKQTATTTTTASLNETTIAGSDVIQFSCIGY